jgi:flavin reductase (DIM6/NTAB) family NADH-FMN oxidoreductase RutF
MTIHSSHPFLPPPEDREPARRLRGRLPAPVSIWTSAAGEARDGWTISSMMVGNGEPAEIIALVNEDADWWELFRETGYATVNVLGQGQGWIADVFARVAPSPGGVFRTGEWSDHARGPRLAGCAAWAEVQLVDPYPQYAGWGLLVRAVIESVDLADGVEALEHRAGRYR